MNKLLHKNNKISPTSYNKEIIIENPKSHYKQKMTDELFMIPDINDYNYMLKYNFKVAQLKAICKYYNLKKTGTKSILLNRIYNFLRVSSSCIIIQRKMREIFKNQYELLHGPAFRQRNKCVNDTDFFTMENLKDIPDHQFFSFKDQHDNLYGFNIISLWNLYLKTGRNTLNPYNREKILDDVYHNLCNFLNHSEILNKDIQLTIKVSDDNLSPEKQQEQLALQLFQHMDELGNYTDIKWFNDLTVSKLCKFCRELLDIWCYRAQLSSEIKITICPPIGDPFRNVNINAIQNNAMSLYEIKKITLSIIGQMIKSATTRDNQALGAFYVLSALTLVNNDAASAMPWLYQSVSQIN